MPRRPGLLAALLVAVAGSAAPAQTVRLAEPVAAGDTCRVDLGLKLTGTVGGRPDPKPLAAAAALTFVERVDAADGPRVDAVARHYSAAAAETDPGPDRVGRELSADRRHVIADRTAAGRRVYSPAGPLTRDELALVSEHFDTLCLPALLPGGDVAVGGTWAVPADAARSACQLARLDKGELTGRLTAVRGGVAEFAVTGRVEGADGGPVTATVSAAGRFDLAAKRVVELTWEQSDDRGPGPAGPAAAVTAVVTIRRTPLTAPPPELAAVTRPAGDVPAELLAVRYDDPAGRFRLTHPRDWHVVGRTSDHVTLRLVEGGAFVAQATVTGWRRAAPGGHTPLAEFRQAVARVAGWQPAGDPTAEELPAAGGRWACRVTASGTQDGKPVVRTFYLVAGPAGHQAAVTVAATPDGAARLAGRDLALVAGLAFPPAD